MDNTPTDLQTATQARTQLREAAELLQRIADFNNPQQQLLAERDHYARMWDDLKTEVLHNLEDMRREQRFQRDELRNAANAGDEMAVKQTERILAELNTIKADLSVLLRRSQASDTGRPTADSHLRSNPAQTNAPWWRFW